MTDTNLSSHDAVSRSTDAVFLANHENGSEEWLELRRSGIGGSEVGTIMGLNRWESAFTLWAKKTGRITETVQPNEAMEWGNRLEPVVLDKFQDLHPDLVVHRDVGTWRHIERDWQIANPDAVFENENGEFGIIEIKTAMYEDDWSDGVPRSYMAQVQWYMSTFGYSMAYVAVLFHGNKYAEFEIDGSDFQQDLQVDRVSKFREYIANDEQPDYDGSTSTLQTVRELHPDIDPEGEEELGNLGVHYFNSLTDLAKAESESNEMKSRVLAAMGNAKRGLIDGKWVVSRQARGTTGTPYLVNKRG